MARSRIVKPGLAKNEVLAEIGVEAQLLFAMLPCYADREGRLEDRPKRIKAEIFPYRDVDVDAILESLATCSEQFIVRYEIDGTRYIQITKFDDHQSPHHKEAESTIPAPPKQEPSKSQARANQDNLGSHAPKQVTSNKNKEQVTSNNETRDNPFDEFWREVHVKKAKRNAEKAYNNAVKRLRFERPDENPHEFLLARMKAFAASPEAKPPDREPIHPATWLNAGRYDDDPETWKRKRSKNGATTVGDGQLFNPNGMAGEEVRRGL